MDNIHCYIYHRMEIWIDIVDVDKDADDTYAFGEDFTYYQEFKDTTFCYW